METYLRPYPIPSLVDFCQSPVLALLPVFVTANVLDDVSDAEVCRYFEDPELAIRLSDDGGFSSSHVESRLTDSNPNTLSSRFWYLRRRCASVCVCEGTCKFLPFSALARLSRWRRWPSSPSQPVPLLPFLSPKGSCTMELIHSAIALPHPMVATVRMSMP